MGCGRSGGGCCGKVAIAGQEGLAAWRQLVFLMASYALISIFNSSILR